MSGKQYLKNQLAVILINLLGMLALALFLIASGNNIQTVLFILVVWLLVLASCLLFFFFTRKKALDRLLNMAEQLEERYLLPEIMQEPERADEQVFYQIMKMAEKSMLEQIGEVQRERKEYKEYIEQWIHEVKTPITAMKLICENNRCSFTRELMAELENINRFTEQALYYARSEHTEKDYSVREIRLSDVVHGAIADSKYLLRQNNVAITVDDMEYSIYSDDKWVRFILDQIISNVIKYRTGHPILHLFAVKENERVVLSVEDNGIGINKTPAKEVEPCVSEIAGKLNIRDILDKYPYQVSGGQKQRCACARAIINNPKLILADEPTGALDSHSAQMLLSTIQSINEQMGATILMVTHDAFTASYASRILFLQDGKIFTELHKGSDSRSAFFDKILNVLTIIGGGQSHVC